MGFGRRTDTAVRLTVWGFMPLSVEDIRLSGDGKPLISICHYGEQNGDLMRDLTWSLKSTHGLTLPPLNRFHSAMMTQSCRHIPELIGETLNGQGCIPLRTIVDQHIGAVVLRDRLLTRSTVSRRISGSTSTIFVYGSARFFAAS